MNAAVWLLKATVASLLLDCARHPASEDMASDGAASDHGSAGDDLLDDVVMEEPAGAAAEALEPQVPANAASSSQPTPKVSAEPAPPDGSRPAKSKRARKPAIDLDSAIRDAAAAMKAAQKKVQEAKTQAKNERRKKQRLLKKAASLNAEDLERIAVLKRCGWTKFDTTPDLGGASSTGSAAGSGASRLSTSDAAPSKAPIAQAAASSGPNPASRA